ncbi:nucleoside triphosphate pyrophosphohydrolase [Candidatus Woesearchaeota archaeon]|nr:nucleoside triphosphate pyrophosphohydrolase [Candidatus Woesearchaeota archaeon]
MKLVRDKIPNIIRKQGRMPNIRIAADSEYVQLLLKKLDEEVTEYQISREPEELADIIEVAIALGKTHKISPAKLEQVRKKKAKERGTFDKKIVWMGNAPK